MSDLDPLRPRPDEVARVAVSLDARALGAVREALRPTEGEVARLRARARPTRRRVPAWGAAVLVAALALLVALGLGRADPLPVGVGVTLGAEAMALGPSIRTWGDAKVVARPHPGGAVVVMEPGTAWFEVDPGGEARALEVRAGEVAIAVTGTRFVVVYDELVTVRVERGSVRVTHAGELVALAAGGAWTSRAVAARDESGDATAGAAAIPSAVEVAAASPEAAAEGPARIPAVTDPEVVRAPAAPVEVRDAAAREEATAAVRDEATEAARAAEPQRAADEARGFADLLDRADRDDPELIVAIEAWLTAHPSSPLAGEAELLRLQALARRSPAQAEPAAAAWLSANPRGSRRGDVLWLHATVARDGLQDCGLALPSYRELAAVGPRQADAAALQGLCAAAVGRHVEARAALGQAVELGVSGALGQAVAEALAAE